MSKTLKYKKQKIFISVLLVVLNMKGYSEQIGENKITQNDTAVKGLEISDIPDENELKIMRSMGIISEEDYIILLDELNGIKDEEMLYSLNINGFRETNGYRLEMKENKIYFPIYSFLESVNLTNYELKDNRLKIKLGDSLTEVIIDLDKGKIFNDGRIYEFEDRVFQNKNDIYLEAELFKSLFLTDYTINEKKYLVGMNLNFTDPKNIGHKLDLKRDELKEKQEENEIVYTNKAHFFDLGYARVNLEKSFSRVDGKTTNDWGGNIEYQGDTLYGNLTTSFDLKEKEVGNIDIEYPDIWKKHVLRVGSYGTGGLGSREWGATFRKDKGYYSSDKTYVIRERVPIGSRAELIYMGFTLEIQDAEEGVVEFRNKEIKSDREYEVKIYSPDGKIEVRKIKTVESYNQQNRNEVEYDIDIRENKESKKISSTVNVYYGITDNLTSGGSYIRDIEKVNDKFEYVNSGRGELIYSNYIKKYPYLLRIGGEKTFDKYKDFENDYSKRYKYDYLAEVTIDNLKLHTETENYGKFYGEKKRDKYEITYDINNWGTIGYNYEKTKMYSEEIEKDSEFTISSSKSFRSLMTTIDYSQQRSGNKEYGVNFYYNGFDKFSVRWENRVTEEKGKNYYETEATLYNNNYRGKIDYNVSLAYSQKYKDRVSFNFTVRLADWFEFSGDIDKERNQRYSAGIDKVVDLQNVRKKVDNMNISRVRVTTFIDENNNDIYDKGEKLIPGVEVALGKEKVVTGKDGTGMFYGVSNSILYELKPKIKKPSFTQGKNKISVKGRTSSTIDAYIPVKPMMTLSGKIEFDKMLTLSEEDKQNIYNEILIRIKDKKGKEIELTMPDNTGEFDVSGLFPEEYNIEVLYTGLRYDIKSLKENVELSYNEDSDDGTRVVFIMSDKKISMNKKEN